MLPLPKALVLSLVGELRPHMPHDEAKKKKKVLGSGTSMVVQWLRLQDLGSIPGQATRCHMWQLKIPSAATKTWYNQVDYKYI